VAQNAARSVRMKTSARDDAREMRPGAEMPTKAELRAMIENAQPRWRPFIVTAIFTGMRASELRGLRWKDVDLDAGVVHVRLHSGNPCSRSSSTAVTRFHRACMT
jgi:integrase